MKHLKLIIVLLLSSSSLFAYAMSDDPLYGRTLIESIPGYVKYGEMFTALQHNYFWIGFLVLLIAIPAIFAVHYAVIGPKVFSHDGRKIYTFSLLTRIVHWTAAFSFVILVPTGFFLVFGDTFGGGAFIRMCKTLHGVANYIFILVVIPMTIIFIKDMIFKTEDIKWMMIVGGYLSKVKRPIPAGKFNAGQKFWFWSAIPGGIIMIITGAIMFDFVGYIGGLNELLGVSQIDLLRISAIVHNILGMVIVAMFFTHVYMTVFSVKGSLESMIYGYKPEEEIEILHSFWYKKLKKEGKL